MESYIGKAISDFTLQSSDGQTISLGSLRGQKVLLYFFTNPGGGNSTRMALGYREHAAKFTEKNVVLFGIHDGAWMLRASGSRKSSFLSWS